MAKINIMKKDSYCFRIEELNDKADLILIYDIIRKATRNENVTVTFSDVAEGLTYFKVDASGKNVAAALKELMETYDDLKFKIMKVKEV